MAVKRTMRGTSERYYKNPYKSVRKYDIEMREGESEEHYFRRLAKVADQRLVRLEKLSEQAEYKQITQYAYAQAMYDISIHGKDKRFNTALPRNEEGEIDRRILKERIISIRLFLTSPLSTKQGVQEYRQRVDKLNANYGTDFTWSEFADFIQSGYAKRMLALINSDLVMKAIARIRQARSKVAEEMEKSTKVTTRDPLDDLALRMLRSKKIKESMKPEELKKVREVIRGR